MSDLADRFARQAAQCRAYGSPLTGALLDGAAAEIDVHGPVRDLLAPLADDPPGSVPSLRFAGALHRLVLERRAPGLALHYPSVGGRAGLDGLWDAARAVVASEPDLPELVTRPVQTNEVGRSAVLAGGLLHVAARTRLPVRLLELGASAGLNLHVDRFAYEVGDQVLGDPASPVRLVQPWTGGLPPDARVEVVHRAGCDPGPLDPTSAEDRLTLTSYVWPDQVARFERLRAALQVAASAPVAVEGLSASAFLERELASLPDDAATVVWHSVVWQYMTPEERGRVTDLLERAGRRASGRAPLALLSMEPQQTGADHYDFQLHLTTWPGGERRLLAQCEGHGPPVGWV